MEKDSTLKTAFDSVKGFVKEHPYAIGAIAIGILLFFFGPSIVSKMPGLNLVPGAETGASLLGGGAVLGGVLGLVAPELGPEIGPRVKKMGQKFVKGDFVDGFKSLFDSAEPA
jgi:hypothetical protein